jgi:predicted nuclease with RNAse H fold
MMVVGIDLSGPTNTADTAVTVFREDDAGLILVDTIEGARDEQIFQLVQGLPDGEEIVVGLDAPLSYNPGGGDRSSDKALRHALIAVGMHPGSVMTPTSTRMVYLTLRGIGVARLLGSAGQPDLKLVEVHPGGALALGGAAVLDVKNLKKDSAARKRLTLWLEGQGLAGVTSPAEPSDHFVASSACALAAWRWRQGKSSWLSEAVPPHYPYDFAC